MYDEDEISHAKNCYLETHVMGKSKEYQAKYEYISSVIPEFMSNKSYETYLTACLHVNSRLSKKQLQGDEPPYIAPVVDKFNYRANGQAKVVYDDERKELTVVATDDIQRGQQIFIETFHEKENPTFLHNSEFLMNYGYLP